MLATGLQKRVSHWLGNPPWGQMEGVSIISVIKEGFSSAAAQLNGTWRYDDVPIGSNLALNLKDFKGQANVVIECGQPESLEIDCTTQPIDEVLSMELKSLQGKKGHSYTQYSASFAAGGIQQDALSIKAQVPAKFFSLTIDINQGSVTVGPVSDADHINITTTGGDVHLNKSRAAIVTVLTSGGNIKGSASGEYVLLASGDAPTVEQSDVSTTPRQRGGDIKLSNIVGNEVFIGSEVIAGAAGAVDINALYADNATVVGGDVYIKTMNCSEHAQVSTSHGSSAIIGGVDGNLHLHCGGGGGSCKVFLNANAQDLVLDLNGNNADITISENEGCSMLLIGCKEHQLPEGARQQTTEDGIAVVIDPINKAPESTYTPPSRLYRGEGDASLSARVVVNATGVSGPGGCVSVGRSNWFQKVMLKRS